VETAAHSGKTSGVRESPRFDRKHLSHSPTIGQDIAIVRRILSILRRSITIALAALLLCGVIGQIVRDRNVIFALMMYVPLVPIGIAAAAWDLILRGRSLPRVRFGMSIIGVILAVISGWMMFGRGPEPAAPAANVVRFMHWNVWWGGAPERRNDATWSVMIDEVRSQWPDIIVLSEAPTKERLRTMARALGAEWAVVNRRQEEEGGADRIGVLSRWPLEKEKTLDFRNGGGMVVRVDHPDGPIRILGVDGLSHPLVPRTPLLDDVAAVCRDYESRGLRIDVICGDFNAMSRSVGFDSFPTLSGGYRLASDRASEWRATYRAGIPLYDIDHVWVHRSRAGLACELFTNLASNHRGQVATFRRAE